MKRFQTTIIRSRNEIETKTLSASEISNPQSIIFIGGPGIAVWHEDNGRTLILLSLKGQSMSTIPIPEGIVRIEAYAVPNHNTFLLAFDTVKSSWAEVWKIEGEHQSMSRIYNIPSKPHSPTSWSANVAPNGKIYFTWSLPHGASEVYSDTSAEPVYKFAGNATEITSSFLSFSEVIPRADNTYALRSFLTSYPELNTHLVLNGDVSWTRPESLSGLQALIWVELLDPTTEEVEDELHVEESQNVLAAYIHRITRHANELITYGPAWAANLPSRILAEFTGTTTESVVDGKFRDAFGFRKLLVGITANGGIVGIDFAQKGKILWSLPHLIDSQAKADIKGFYEVGKGIVGIVTSQGQYIEINVFDGKVLSQEAPGEIGHVLATSLINGSGDKKVILAVVKSRLYDDVSVRYYGGDENTSVVNDLYLTIPDTFGDVHGYKVEPKV